MQKPKPSHPPRVSSSPLLALALLFSMAAQADCVLPAPPSRVPDGHSASLQEMAAATQTFQKYNEDVADYTKCLLFEQKRSHMTFGDADVHRTAALDTLSSALARFNEQVRIFKSRHS